MYPIRGGGSKKIRQNVKNIQNALKTILCTMNVFTENYSYTREHLLDCRTCKYLK